MKNNKCVIRRAVSIMVAVLLSTAQADSKLKGPQVKGAEAFQVRIDDSSEVFKYYAPLFLGQRMQWMDVLYDTMSDWTVIDQDYDPDESATASPWLEDDDNIYNDVVVGSQSYSGPIFDESMCLIRGEDNDNHLCVKKSPMVLAPIGNDLNGYEGVLGLSHGEMNYVKLLMKEYVLQKNLISLDYDTHIQTPSSVTFGDFDKSLTKDGNLYVLPNEGHSKWSLKVQSASIGDRQVSNEEKIAFIDSGNATIQLPRDEFNQVYDEIKKIHVDHVRFREQYEFGQKVRMIVASQECDDIIDDLPTLKITVAPGVVIVIEPMAYVLPPKDGDFYCTISLAASNENVYRLGTQFLKNFYTVLDFENNQIMLGSKSKHAEIYGDESLLYQEPEPIPDPEPVKPDDEVPDDGDHKDDSEEKQDDEEQGKTDDDSDDQETPADDQDTEQNPDDHQDDEPIDDDKHDDDHDQEEQDQDKPEEHHEEDHHEEEHQPEKPEEHHEEEHHEEEHHEEEHHEEEHHEEQHQDPKPSKPQHQEKHQPKPSKKQAPAKPKTWIDLYIIDPIMNPIYSMIHFVQAEIDLVTNMIFSPLKMLTSLKMF